MAGQHHPQQPTPSLPWSLTHVSQQPTPMGCRQVQSRQLVLSHDSPRENCFPSYSQGAAKETVVMRTHEPVLGFVGASLPPLYPKTGDWGCCDLPLMPWCRRYSVASLPPGNYEMPEHLPRALFPSILSWPCPAALPITPGA